jgi:ribosome maturation factor RimP
MANQLLEKVKAVLVPAVEAAGYEVVELEWKREQSAWILRLFIDNPLGGVSHTDCERVSREVSAVLDVHDVVRQHYNLEVSSPGLNRPLRTPAHFRRFIGQKARIRLRRGIEGRRNFAGQILAVTAEAVKVEVEGKEWDLPFTDLDRANLEYQFTSPERRPTRQEHE